jgi:L-rhamnose isomerase
MRYKIIPSGYDCLIFDKLEKRAIGCTNMHLRLPDVHLNVPMPKKESYCSLKMDVSRDGLAWDATPNLDMDTLTVIKTHGQG